MDFTREPIIETIITPKEGYKLVIRSSKGAGQEEFLVDAVEIVSYGSALFFRSLERPKSFLVPVSDYEAIEVREARAVLKAPGLDRSIKIGGGREATLKAGREAEKGETLLVEEREVVQEEIATGLEEVGVGEEKQEGKLEKRKDRRRHYRKRKGREEGVKAEGAEPIVPPLEDEKIKIATPEKAVEAPQEAPLASTLLSSLLQPPPKLISETISHYRQLFKGAFYLAEEEEYKPHDKVQELLNEEDEEEAPPYLQEPSFETEEQPSLEFPPSVEKQEEIKEISEEEKEGESTSSSHERIEEDEPEPGLPLHPEEDTIMEHPYYTTEDEEPMQKNHPASHNGHTT